MIVSEAMVYNYLNQNNLRNLGYKHLTMFPQDGTIDIDKCDVETLWMFAVLMRGDP